MKQTDNKSQIPNQQSYEIKTELIWITTVKKFQFEHDYQKY